MRLSLAPLTMLLGLALCAQSCMAPPTALPQVAPTASGSPTIVSGELVSLFGDTVEVAVHIRRAPAIMVTETIPKIVPDTVWCNTSTGICTKERPAAPTDTIVPVPVRRGVPYGSWHTRGFSMYNGTVLNSGSSDLAQVLAKARADRAKVHLVLSRTKTRNPAPDTVLSVAATRKHLLAIEPTVRPYLDVLAGVIVSDDVNDKLWGPYAPYWARLDSLARITDSVFPGVPTWLRDKPSDMERYGKPWVWMDGAIGQYSAIPRDSTPQHYRKVQVASAQKQGLCLMLTVNQLQGRYAADGKTRIPLTPAQLVEFATEFLPYSVAFLPWREDSVYERRADVQAAMATIRAIADTTPLTVCQGR